MAMHDKIDACKKSCLRFDGYRVAVSGACANTVEALVMHPLDTIKTRLQLEV